MKNLWNSSDWGKLQYLEVLGLKYFWVNAVENYETFIHKSYVFRNKLKWCCVYISYKLYVQRKAVVFRTQMAFASLLLLLIRQWRSLRKRLNSKRFEVLSAVLLTKSWRMLRIVKFSPSERSSPIWSYHDPSKSHEYSPKDTKPHVQEYLNLTEFPYLLVSL